MPLPSIAPYPALLLAAIPMAAVPPADPAFLDAWRSITAAGIAAHVEVLASDAFEGREPGTAGEGKTLAYLEDHLSTAGLAPGHGGGYLQPVPLVEVRRDGEPAFAAGPAGRETAFTFRDDFVAFAGRPGTASDLEGLPLVFAGYGITSEAFAWDDYRGADVTGAAVLLVRGEPGSDQDSTLFGGKALTTFGMTNTKYDIAAAHGARAAVVIHTEATAGFPWSVMTGGGLGSAQNFLAGDGEPGLELIVHLSEPAARRLLAAAGRDLDDLLARAATPGFAAEPLGLTASATYRAKRRDIESHNVIAVIRGSEAPEECVIYTAHWDHVGRNDELPGDDKIFNGAVDNATGTAGLLEIAAAFRRLPAPRRTVYFVFTTAEEKGLLGSEYLASHPPAPLSRIVAVINLDALFPFGSFDAFTVTGLGSSEVEDVLAGAAARVGRVLQDDSEPQAGAYFRSDHYPFAKRGVPALFAVGGPRNEELVEGNPVLDKFMNYLSNGYHKVTDEYDAATWDLAGIEEDVRALFETGWRIAGDTRYPNWTYGNEFRPLRDRMLAR